jgi:gamma-glutamyltranspeptidase / glutathione hydrolase
MSPPNAPNGLSRSRRPRGHRVVEMPPNGQGLIVLMTLRILEGYDLARIFRSDIATLAHLILEALKLSFADAER